MPREVSPAAAGAISRLLKGAGVPRAVEHSKGIEYEGFWAAPHGDHVRVDYAPNYWVEPDLARPVVEAGLARCRSLLEDRYDVTTTELDIVYGGNPPMKLPVLEVRDPAWTRTDAEKHSL